MDRRPENPVEAEARKKAEKRTTLIPAAVFWGMIVLMIAVMAGIDIYTERQAEAAHQAPADAADR